MEIALKEAYQAGYRHGQNDLDEIKKKWIACGGEMKLLYETERRKQRQEKIRLASLEAKQYRELCQERIAEAKALRKLNSPCDAQKPEEKHTNAQMGFSDKFEL